MIFLSITENILYFITGFGILQGIILAGLLYFHPKSDRSVNTFLALYVFCISAVMTMPVTINAVGWKNSYFLMPIPLLPGIFLYFYVISFKRTITWQKALPHFVIVIIVFFLAYWNLSAIARIYPDAKEIPPEALKRPVTLSVVLIRALQQIIYFFLCRRALKSYQQSIRQLFSETSRIDLNWTRFLINGFIIITSAFLVIFPLLIRFPEYFNSLLLANMAVATPYIYIATFKGIIQPTIWQINPGLKKEIVEEEIKEAEQIETYNGNGKIRSSKSSLPEDKIEEITQKVIRLMEKDKLYQEPELTLQQLADKIQLSSYQVSQAINDGLKKNFYDIINGYRVEEAKRLLLDSKNKNYTILSVGFEAGFNSKTTFNTVFKKFTGLTPTEYRDKQKLSVAV